MKVYGADICIDCRNYKAVQRSRGFAAEYVDITESTLNLREFLKLRDEAPLFDAVKQHGGIGIPLFVREDGTMTLDINEALSWIGERAVEAEELPEKYPVCGENGCR